MSVRAISYGGGVQSTALVVLACTGRIEADLAIFANVGDKAENPKTLDYVRRWAMPYAATHGLELIERNRGGKQPDLYDRLMDPDANFLGIPVYFGDNGRPVHRSCTRDYKIDVIARELKLRGASEEQRADVLIGISTDEIARANSRKARPHERIEYPLLDLGLSRLDCMHVISDAGLPVPPKSACWFCPFHTRPRWAQLRTDEPELFERVAQLEDSINSRRAARGLTRVWICNARVPIRRAIPDSDALPFDEPDPAGAECDSGWCMT